MGAAASVVSEIVAEIPQVVLRKLPEAVEEAVYVHERFPLIIDVTEQASRFFKYQTGAFINFNDPTQATKAALNRALVHSLLNGRTMTIKLPTLQDLNESIFDPDWFPREALDRSRFFDEAVWRRVLKDHDPNGDDAAISPEFALIICTATAFVPPSLAEVMHVFLVVEQPTAAAPNNTNNNSSNNDDPTLEAIAALCGATEIIRNSAALVEAAFDGDINEVQSQLAKGYHLESMDGRKHTALSEAAAQGHLPIVILLLSQGADPNALSDTGRSPLWRAAFNGHVETVRTLLEAGGDPSFRDRVSMEGPFDIASNEETRLLLSSWDINVTAMLVETRRRHMLSQLENRIATAVEREELARRLIRQEIVEKASKGDVQGVKMTLQLSAEEVQQSGASRPRVNAEARNEQGQSLLSIAAQFDYVDLALFLLTYWKTVDEDRLDLAEGEISTEAKIFKANVNSRDLKGWSCIAIAVFHDSLKVLALLLDHGADPSLRSSYNKSAWDLAKDELDAAEKVIRSKAATRQILVEWDRERQRTSGLLFGNGSSVRIMANDNTACINYSELDEDGGAMVMNIELNQEMARATTDNDNKANKKKAGKSPAASGGGKANKNTGSGSGGGKPKK